MTKPSFDLARAPARCTTSMNSTTPAIRWPTATKVCAAANWRCNLPMPPDELPKLTDPMRKHGPKPQAAALVIVGGFAGTGKTAISRRLSAEFCIPRLASDTIGRAIKDSAGVKNGKANAYWIAYDLLFSLCEEFVQASVSVILDLTMGWEFQWQRVDGIIRQYPQTVFLPIILRCPYERCIERTQQRHQADPERYDPPEVYETEAKNRSIWEFLARLDRGDIHWVDADRPYHEVYQDVRDYVSAQLVWT